jgi:DNA-binding XRE family transcriptional regulator
MRFSLQTYSNSKRIEDTITEPIAPSWQEIEPVRNRFGKRLQSIRTDKGMTQMQLAIEAGLDRSFISDMENGKKEPTISTLDQIAVAMNISLSDLLMGV